MDGTTFSNLSAADNAGSQLRTEQPLDRAE